MRTWLVVLFLWACGLEGSTAPANPSVELTREGGAFRLRGDFAVNASSDVAWRVLTDYEGMTSFLPSLRKSRVASRSPEGTVIEQEGVARALVFTRKVSLTLKVVERPPGRIEFFDLGKREFEEY